MNPKPNSSYRTILALTICAAGLFTSPQSAAQSPSTKAETTWQDLGFMQLPEGFSAKQISLFQGLNESRGTWAFEGQVTDREEKATFEGILIIEGNPQAGMLPFWKMDLRWPADDPERMIKFNITASPQKTGFNLMLIRIGPIKESETIGAKPRVTPTLFKGKWNPENSTINWTESNLPAGLNRQTKKRDSSKPKETFNMIVSVDGKILIPNNMHTAEGKNVSGKAIKRTGKPPAAPVTLTGKHSFKTVAAIADPRIQPSLPPQATEISIISERGGHFARYKIAEQDFKKFLDRLWETKKDSSAHQRDHMSGEGEPANRDRMVRRFQAAGWEPLDNAVTYFSPSKRNGAMTTYYYDREAGIAYHDTGYW